MCPIESDRAGVLLVHEGSFLASAETLGLLSDEGFEVAEHALGAEARESDRAALPELDGALDRLRRRPGVDPERVAVLGIGRGGTLAFLLGCTRRLAAVVDVDGPVLHAELSASRPIQPLELALNLEGAFLGVFSAEGAVGAEERELLRECLVSAARPFEIVEAPGREIVVDPRLPGYDGAQAMEPWRRVLAFLRETLAAAE